MGDRKAKGIELSQELQEYLGVSVVEINKKLDIVLNRRASENDYDVDVARDYLELFSKNEILALFLVSSTQAGYLQYKILELKIRTGMSQEVFHQIMTTGLPSRKEMLDMIRSKPSDDQPVEEQEDEDFI